VEEEEVQEAEAAAEVAVAGKCRLSAIYQKMLPYSLKKFKDYCRPFP
jgi:hypothetical protein